MQTMRYGCVILAVSACFAVESQAQAPGVQEQAKIVALPVSQQEASHRKAITLYGLGMLRVKQDRLVEASHLLEDALELDAESAAIQKGLVPLYLALGRRDDALLACKKALDLDPQDHETWSTYGRQLRARGKIKEAQAAFRLALECPGSAERLDLRLQLQYDIGALCEESEQCDQALAAFGEVVKGLESAQAPAELDSLSQQDIRQQAASTIERMIKLCLEARQ